MAWTPFPQSDLWGVFIDSRSGEVRRSGGGGDHGVFYPPGSELLGYVRRLPLRDFAAKGADGLSLLTPNGGEQQFGSVVEAATALVNFMPYQP